MNAFLVIARLLTDDIPLALFADGTTAHVWAMSISEKDAVAKNSIMFADPRSFASCVGIVQFIDGQPQKFKVVQDFS